jgi:hypothetical protein
MVSSKNLCSKLKVELFYLEISVNGWKQQA